jgi:hypothetical protein
MFELLITGTISVNFAKGNSSEIEIGLKLDLIVGWMARFVPQWAGPHPPAPVTPNWGYLSEGEQNLSKSLSQDWERDLG